MGDDLQPDIKRALVENSLRASRLHADWKARYDAEQAQYRAEAKHEARKVALIACSIIAAFVAAFGGTLWYAIKHQNAVYARFMAGCLQDHKEYECMAMWRASDSRPPAVIPVPIPIYIGK
jgi:hypothetical protein